MKKCFFVYIILLSISASTFADLRCAILINKVFVNLSDAIPKGTKVEIVGLHPNEIHSGVIGKIGIVIDGSLDLDPLGVYSGRIRLEESDMKYDFFGVKVRIIEFKKYDKNTILVGTKVKIIGLNPNEIYSESVIGKTGVVIRDGNKGLIYDAGIRYHSGIIKLQQSGKEYDFFGVNVEIIE